MSGTRPRRYHPMIFWSSAGVKVLQSRPIICGRPPNCNAEAPAPPAPICSEYPMKSQFRERLAPPVYDYTGRNTIMLTNYKLPLPGDWNEKYQ